MRLVSVSGGLTQLEDTNTAIFSVLYVYVLPIYLITLCVCVIDWQTEYGGITSYIAKGEDEEVRPTDV